MWKSTLIGRLSWRTSFGGVNQLIDIKYNILLQGWMGAFMYHGRGNMFVVGEMWSLHLVKMKGILDYHYLLRDYQQTLCLYLLELKQDQYSVDAYTTTVLIQDFWWGSCCYIQAIIVRLYIWDKMTTCWVRSVGKHIILPIRLGESTIDEHNKGKHCSFDNIALLVRNSMPKRGHLGHATFERVDVSLEHALVKGSCIEVDINEKNL